VQTRDADIVKTPDIRAEKLGGLRGFLGDGEVGCPAGADRDHPSRG